MIFQTTLVSMLSWASVLAQAGVPLTAEEIIEKAYEAEEGLGVVRGKIERFSDSETPEPADSQIVDFVFGGDYRYQESREGDGDLAGLVSDGRKSAARDRIDDKLSLYPHDALADPLHDLHFHATKNYDSVWLVLQPLHRLEAYPFESLRSADLSIVDSSDEEVSLSGVLDTGQTVSLRFDVTMGYRLIEYRMASWSTYSFDDFEQTPSGHWLPRNVSHEIAGPSLTITSRAQVTEVTTGLESDPSLFRVEIPQGTEVVDYGKFGNYMGWVVDWYDFTDLEQWGDAASSIRRAFPAALHAAWITLLALLTVVLYACHRVYRRSRVS